MATCTQHDVETNLSCRTCGTPVCPDCAVHTAVGVTCATHAAGTKKEAAGAMAPRVASSRVGGRMLIGGAALALVIGAVVILRPSGGGGGGGEEGWTVLPSAPLAQRSDFPSVTTGRSLIVWGGNSLAGPLNDGAVFDTATSEWKPMAAAPLVARRGHAAVWPAPG